jgi:mannose-6-phosphate isomerase-like protein (cupin superfamily)
MSFAGDEPERLWFFDTTVIVRIAPDRGRDGTCVLEHFAGAGDSPPLHVHREQDEVFVMLAGAARFRLADRDLHAGAGECLLVPKGAPHSYLVTSREGARWLTITRGRDFFDFVRAVGRPATRDGLPDPSGPPTEAEREAIFGVAQRHGIDFVGPPLS